MDTLICPKCNNLMDIKSCITENNVEYQSFVCDICGLTAGNMKQFTSLFNKMEADRNARLSKV
jgi:transcription elongation factor Elf1